MINKRNIYFSLIISLFLLISGKIYSQGPMSPEASSFEPVDATDMVNLFTGDLSYVLPMLYVPGPEGGYPVSLSYHAGIAMGQEASWVGLGWNINPGAINRTVNGFPDDWGIGSKSTIVFNAGGIDTGYNIGVSVGIGDSASVGVYASYSTHKTFNGENSHRFDGGVTAGIGGLSASLGTDGFGIGIAANVGNNIGNRKNSDDKNGINVGVSAGFHHSFIDGSNSGSLGVSLGANYEKQKNAFIKGGNRNLFSTGVNFSSTGNTQLSGGFSSGVLSSNSTAGSVSYSNTNINLTIPIYGVNISFGYNKSKYWRYNSSHIKATGVLHPWLINHNLVDEPLPNIVVFDSYESLYKTDYKEQYSENNFAFPSYDGYSISGQGIGGSMTPKLYELGSLKIKGQRSNKGSTYGLVKANNLNRDINFSMENGIIFHFDNINASFLKVRSNGVTNPTSSLNNIFDVDAFGSLDSDVTIDGINYNNYNHFFRRKTVGPFVETFTNQKIMSNPSVIFDIDDFNRNNIVNENPDLARGVGAYKITTADGKTYHYSIPVYQKEEFSKSTENGYNIDNAFVENQSLTPYATHWLLTAITGPDFVDNGDNKISDGDLGYWVVFKYGKWTDGFVWRNPPAGYSKTEVSKSYSWGIKEIYYLNEIKTRTHTALFIKSLRQDNKSFSISNVGTSRAHPKNYSDNKVKSFVSSLVGDNIALYISGIYTRYGPFFWNQGVGKINYDYFYKCNEHKTLKLSKVVLLKNSDIPDNLNTDNGNNPVSSFRGDLYMKETLDVWSSTGQHIYNESFTPVDKTWYGEFYSNVLDTQDISILAPNIEDKAIKVIDFTYANQNLLAQGTFNSSAPNKGKLTLSEVNFKGKEGSILTPPFKFDYYDRSSTNTIDDMDSWGYKEGNERVWSLKEIVSPIGNKIGIEYESDDYYQNSVPFKRIFRDNLKFKFKKVSDKLIINIKNEDDDNPIDFTNYFILGNTNIDLFVCEKYKYWIVDPSYVGWRTDTDKIIIDDSDIVITQITSNNLTLEISSSYILNSINNIDNTYFGLNDYPSSWYMNYFNTVRNCPDDVRNEYMIQFQYSLESNIADRRDLKGGGVRVKSISVTDEINSLRRNYYYNQDNFAENSNSSEYRSSGITSYTPTRYSQEIPYYNELPAPYVTYSRVTVRETYKVGAGFVHPISKVIYNFKNLVPLKDNVNSITIGDIFSMRINNQREFNNIDVGNFYNSSSQNAKVTIRDYKLVDNFNSLGRLDKIESFSGNQLIEASTYKYKDISILKQGVDEEIFNIYKYIKPSSSQSNETIYHINTSSRLKYPNVLESTTILKNGFSQTTYFDKYSFDTGQLLEYRTYTSDGNKIKSITVPAYSKYNLMGSKVDGINNKNMLNQKAASFNYFFNNTSNQWHIANASIQTWNNDWKYRDFKGAVTSPTIDKKKIWRKHKKFVWKGEIDENGMYVGFNEKGFKWGIGATQTDGNWKNISTTTMYNHFSIPLEYEDINSNHVSTKMGNDHSKIFTTSNAKYTSMFYCGAEDILDNFPNRFSGEVMMAATGAYRDNTKYHTGKYSVSADQGKEAFGVDIINSGNYKASVWVHKDNYNDNIVLVSNEVITPKLNEIVYAGDWVQLNFNFNIKSTVSDEYPQHVYIKSTNGVVNFDDFRLLPIASTMTSYVYNEWDELSYVLGANNMGTKYEYNSAGQLWKKYSEIENSPVINGGYKLIKKYGIHYGLMTGQ